MNPHVARPPLLPASHMHTTACHHRPTTCIAPQSTLASASFVTEHLKGLRRAVLVCPPMACSSQLAFLQENGINAVDGAIAEAVEAAGAAAAAVIVCTPAEASTIPVSFSAELVIFNHILSASYVSMPMVVFWSEWPCEIIVTVARGNVDTDDSLKKFGGEDNSYLEALKLRDVEFKFTKMYPYNVDTTLDNANVTMEQVDGATIFSRAKSEFLTQMACGSCVMVVANQAWSPFERFAGKDYMDGSDVRKFTGGEARGMIIRQGNMQGVLLDVSLIQKPIKLIVISDKLDLQLLEDTVGMVSRGADKSHVTAFFSTFQPYEMARVHKKWPEAPHAIAQASWDRVRFISLPC